MTPSQHQQLTKRFSPSRKFAALMLSPVLAITLVSVCLSLFSTLEVDAAAPTQTATLPEANPEQQTPDEVAMPAPSGQIPSFRVGWSENTDTWVEEDGVTRVIHRGTNVALGDMDQDGDLDLAVGYSCSSGGCGSSRSEKKIYLQIFENDQENNDFILAQTFSSEFPINWTSVAWGDMDQDGDLDLVVGLWSPDKGTHMLENEGTNNKERFSEGPTSDIFTTVDVALGDLNGNGNLDIGLANFGEDNPSVVYSGTNDAKANLSSLDKLWEAPSNARVKFIVNADGQSIPPGRGGYGTIDFGDLDDDKDLDIALSFAASVRPAHIEAKDRVTVYRNNRTGSIMTTSTTFSNTGSLIIAKWGDFDQIGGDDLAVGAVRASNRILTSTENTSISEAPIVDEVDNGTTALAVGDIDNDGDLDLVVGNDGIHPIDGDAVYLNDGDATFESPRIILPVPLEYTSDIAIGDVDGDGDLDIVTTGDGTYVILNQGESGRLSASATEISTDVHSVAWGDVDGDGDLDLAVGRQTNRRPLIDSVYINEDGSFIQKLDLPGTAETTWEVAWGNVDGGKNLVLAAGTAAGPDEDEDVLGVYYFEGQNEAVTVTHYLTYSITTADGARLSNAVHALAWGNVVGDEALELVVGGRGSRLYVFEVDAGKELKRTEFQICAETRDDPKACTIQITYDIALGDLNQDGQLEIAVGNTPARGNNHIFRLPQKPTLDEGVYPIWSSEENDRTQGIAWGDVNGDGFPDLAVGNFVQANRVYMNHNGVLEKSASWSSLDKNQTTAVAWVDIDGDGDLDLTASNSGSQRNKVYLNEDGILNSLGVPLTLERKGTNDLAWGDIDSDGDMDLALGDFSLNAQPSPNSTIRKNLQNELLRNFKVSFDFPPTNEDFSAVSDIYDQQIIPIPYTLTLIATDGTPEVSNIIPSYSLDGGDNWRPAKGEFRSLPSQELVDMNKGFSTQDGSNRYRFDWNVYESGVWGQSDHVVFRLEALPSVKPQLNAKAGSYMYPKVTAQTQQFRVRGSQIRLVLEEYNEDSALSGGLVFRRRQDENVANVLGTADRFFTTDSAGYLASRQGISTTDELFALLPIEPTSVDPSIIGSFHLFATNITTDGSGFTFLIEGEATLVQSGINTITVSADRPLMLFDLDISLEWDATGDAPFQERLRSDLQRTSELLYDWTNGQAALGTIRVHQNRDQWNEADIRILASNRLRPNADLGGIVTESVTETVPLSSRDELTRVLYYLPGQVRMPVNWNRFGDAATGDLGEDWPRALAHELGHYLFFLHDNYFGYDDSGTFTSVTDCPGVMSVPYRTDDGAGYDEFLSVHNPKWANECENTFSNRRAGRADWQTIKDLYPALNVPKTDPPNAGPSALPLAVTQVEIKPPQTEPDSDPLPVPFFSLVRENGKRYFASGQARAFLLTDDTLIDLGRPLRDQMKAWGATPGQKLCVFDTRNGVQYYGCVDVVTDSSLQVPMKPLLIADQIPVKSEIIVTPLSTQTVQINVTFIIDGASSDLDMLGIPLQGRLYPSNGPASEVQPLEGAVGSRNRQVFTATFTNAITRETFVRISGEINDVAFESITSYTIGGSPTSKTPVGAGSNDCTFGSRPGCGTYHAPILSGDGQALVFGASLDLGVGQFYALQTTSLIPDPPPWATPVGQAYRLLGSPDAPALNKTNFTINYLDGEVPPGEEQWLTIYYYNEVDDEWIALDTTRDFDNNIVAASTVGQGFYALMSSIEIELPNAGWNFIGYPVSIPPTRPVTVALSSIAPNYSLVYGYDTNDPESPWKVAASITQASAYPSWVNDLDELTFGQGYLIYITAPTTLKLRGNQSLEESNSEGPNVAPLQLHEIAPRTPPAVYYLEFDAELSTAEMPTVSILIDGEQCEIKPSITVADESITRYLIKVPQLQNHALCGSVDEDDTFAIHFEFNSNLEEAVSFITEPIVWDNRSIQGLTLAPSSNYRH
ncbi:MAG: VCBS repeat-containing protein [Chloroflexota bacterium]